MKIVSLAIKALLAVLAGLLSAALLAICVGIGIFFYFDANLPAVDDAASFHLSEPLRIYTADGKLIRKYGTQYRLPVTYDEIPPVLVEAFVAAEDDRFFQHPGVDYQGILRAAINLVLTGRKSEGGSTITMQLARDLYLSPERTYVRKIKEIILALRIESQLSKQAILQLYLNKIYLGSGAYGVAAAAKVYYDAPLSELTLAQAAMIAGLPKAPTTYSPLNNPERALQRRGYVLGRMLGTGKIDRDSYEQAMAQPLTARSQAADTQRFAADHVAEMVRQEMLERYGEDAYTGGYRVYTTISSDRQRAAMAALRKGLLAYDARHGWRGAQTQLPAAVLDDHEQLLQALQKLPRAGQLVPGAVMAVADDHMQLQTRKYGEIKLGANDNPWLSPGQSAAKLVERGDVVWLVHEADADDADAWKLAQIPEVQGALVSLDPHDGAIQALVGGFDFGRSKFNRAIDAYRQPGSSIKPFVYAAALANGFTTASLINDAPVVYGVHSADSWRPQNYSHNVHGPTRLREGLVYSRNLMTIRLLRAVGISTAIDYLARFGLPRERMPHDLTLALGSATFTPMQMATGYAVMANGGSRVKPYLIAKITAGEDRVVYQATPAVACAPGSDCAPMVALQPADGTDAVGPTDPTAANASADYAPRVITADNAYIISDIMRDVISRGTGGGARVLGRHDLSGKTGTTNDWTDAWFVGFDASLVAVSWVGFDSPRTLGRGETGSRAALPVWVDYMSAALKGVPESLLPRPENIVDVSINPNTGQRALGGGGKAEIFVRGTQPTAEEAETYRGFDPSVGDDGRIF